LTAKGGDQRAPIDARHGRRTLKMDDSQISKKPISRSSTFVKAFDILWFGFAVSWTVFAAVATLLQRFPFGILFVAWGSLFCAFGYWSLKRDWKLVDEVCDEGDALLVRKGSVVARITLSDIASIEEKRFVRPPRILLELKQPGSLGVSVSFIPRDGIATAFGRQRSVADSIRERLVRVA
jgi:hypothetical protein